MVRKAFYFHIVKPPPPAMPDWIAITRQIGELSKEKLALSATRPAAGGCINRAIVLDTDRRRYFVKYNAASRREMFAAEADGLRALQAAGAIRVPTPVCTGVAGDAAFLALEYLQLASGGRAVEEKLGRQLAALHRTTQPRFGWHRDNTIGATPQINTPAARWSEFFRDARLGFQLRLAADRGYRPVRDEGERLLAHLGWFLDGYDPPPSLLHGDLWSGNAAATTAGEPVIFDPAVYFGDREADLAMTELFGGFSSVFYDAYAEAWPLAPGYPVRRTLYNLYHVLNHLNLFGGGYLAQAQRMMAQLLAEVR